VRYTFNLYNARLSHVLSTGKEQLQGLDRQAECARDLPPDKNTPAVEQDRDFIIPLADNVPLGQSCEQDDKDVATSEDFYVISCLSSSLDSKVKAYSYNNTAENNCKALRATVYNV
jgi:hypothetical protein